MNLKTSTRRADANKPVLDRVDTFIGRNDRGEYIKVESTENLSAPGVIFRYASYVREQEALLGYYLDCYHENLGGAWCILRKDQTISRTDETFPGEEYRGYPCVHRAGEKFENFACVGALCLGVWFKPS